VHISGRSWEEEEGFPIGVWGGDREGQAGDIKMGKKSIIQKESDRSCKAPQPCEKSRPFERLARRVNFKITKLKNRPRYHRAKAGLEI